MADRSIPEAGTPEVPLLLGGHQPAKGGGVTTSCFSQWWIAPSEVDGNRYARTCWALP
ncbi:hypothetical protein [Taibaiella helva]|uniref:hypothetical protein n=1 Tax=Taibaiella helva TaxID=2301235 RepID=UPI0013009CBF|nr:hypothetical protein [Taibaiella helva]